MLRTRQLGRIGRAEPDLSSEPNLQCELLRQRNRMEQTVDRLSSELGAAAIGKRVRIRMEGEDGADDDVYEGVVLHYDEQDGYQVRYDDGDEGWASRTCGETANKKAQTKSRFQPNKLEEGK